MQYLLMYLTDVEQWPIPSCRNPPVAHQNIQCQVKAKFSVSGKNEGNVDDG